MLFQKTGVELFIICMKVGNSSKRLHLSSGLAPELVGSKKKLISDHESSPKKTSYAQSLLVGFIVFNVFTGYNMSQCMLSSPGVGCIRYVTLAL